MSFLARALIAASSIIKFDAEKIHSRPMLMILLHELSLATYRFCRTFLGGSGCIYLFTNSAPRIVLSEHDTKINIDFGAGGN